MAENWKSCIPLWRLRSASPISNYHFSAIYLASGGTLAEIWKFIRNPNKSCSVRKHPVASIRHTISRFQPQRPKYHTLLAETVATYRDIKSPDKPAAHTPQHTKEYLTHNHRSKENASKKQYKNAPQKTMVSGINALKSQTIVHLIQLPSHNTKTGKYRFRYFPTSYKIRITSSIK